MRKGIWLLASCGIVALGLGLAFADVSLGQAADESAVSLTDPISTSPKADLQNSSGNPAQAQQKANSDIRSARTGTIVNADQQIFDTPDFDAPPAKKASLIHAEYRTPAGKSERRIVRQVGAIAGSFPFEDPADSGAGGGSPSNVSGQSAPAKSASRTETRKALVAHSDAGSRGGLDGSQTPVVTVQWVKKSPLSVGQECACDLVIKNGGSVTAKEVSVDAYFPATVRLTRSEPMPVDNQDHVTWSLPVLGGGEERTIHITLVPSKRGELSTTALVRFTAQASNVFVVEEPLLNVSLQGPKDLMVGDPATQSITVSNPGTGIAHNVTIEAKITKGLEHPHGDRMTVQVGSLNPGETRLVRLPLVAVGGGVQTIAIRASAAGDLHRELATKINVVAPSVKVAVEGPTFRYVGRKAAYLITVTNDGGTPSNNVHVTHVLPEGFRFVRADKGGEFDEPAHTINWFIGRLELKESVQLKVELTTTELGTHVHSVAAVSEQGARSDGKLETVVDGTASPEVEIIAQNNPVEIGVETAYEIHVRNDGSKAAENVTISCEMVPAAAVEILRAEGATATATPEGKEKGLFTFRPIPLLDPGKTAIYRVYVRGRKEGNHRFRVRLSADSIKEPLVYEEMTKFYTE
jgi:uncharacterized repeat protein (TIGR01451 family)